MTKSNWTFAPYLHLDNAREAIDWYVSALGATIKERHEMDDGTIGHAELDLHGNMLCLADCAVKGEKPKSFRDVPISLYAVVPDVDAVFDRAIARGAQIERALADQDYGHRNGGFVDPFGHVWYLSTPIAR